MKAFPKLEGPLSRAGKKVGKRAGTENRRALSKAGPNEPVCSELLKTRFGDFYVGQAVTYSVQPLVQNGLGMATRSGILTVGQTYGDFILGEDGVTEEYRDICEWEIASDVRPRIGS